jgi:hypothetical protein
MKTSSKKFFATIIVFLLFCLLVMPLTAFAENTEIPKGYVDPIIELDLKKGDVNGFADFWDRLEEIRLVPYEAFLVHFDAFYKRAENKRFHPISGDTLIIKRGEVIPEYRLDVSYGPFNYTTGGVTNIAEATGEFIMKNIQFGTTKGAGILYNVGGSFTAYGTSESGGTSTYGWEFEESRDYGNQYHLPEASYAAVARIEDDPNTMIVRADAYAVTDGDSFGKLTGAMVNFRVEGVKLAKASLVSQGQKDTEIDTWADKEKGETSTSIPEALAIAIIGGAAAMAGAGAGGSGDGGDGGGKKKSRYKMCLHKDFGDAIRYDTQPVTVYARIVEVTPEGEEIDRPDLTSAIEIFSGGNLTVEGSSMAGNYMGALVSAKSVPGGENPGTGVISIRLSGEEGSFQNNVTFRLVGDPYISLAGPNISVLVGSKAQFAMPVEFVDFTEPPTNIVLDGDPLPITVEQDEQGNYYIEVTDDTPKPEVITKFYEEIPCTISANSGEEVVKAGFSVLKCYEGILADFLGKENEIMAYKNEEGEMPTTNIGFQAGVWDKNGQELNLIAPKSMEMFYKDKEGIYEIIGLSFKENADLSTSAHTVYSFTADKSLPSPDKIEGTLAYSGKVGDTIIKNETTIYLIPDLLTYAKEFEEEFKNCEHIIFTYMSGELMKRKAAELYRDKNKLGLKDLQAFRRHCWEIAKRMVLQKKEDYLKESYWYDERIAELELVTFVGDGAFAVALTPLGGPITAFLVDNAKSTFLELCEIYVKEGDAFTWEALEEVVWNRFKQTIGSVDNFVGMPEDASWKVKTAWVCSYFLYRVFYHWYYDEDDAGNSLGIVAALENAALDFGVSRITALFGDYVKGVAKKDGIDFSKRINAEEGAVEKALAGAFDMADKGAGALDNAVEAIVDFVKSIQVV